MAAAAAAAAKKQFYQQNTDQQQQPFYEIDHLKMENDQDDDDDDDDDGNDNHNHYFEQLGESQRKQISIDRNFTQKTKKDEIENSLVNPFSPFQQRSTFDSTQPSQCSGNTRLFPYSAQEKRRISSSQTGDLISSHYFPSKQNQNGQLQIKGALLGKTLKYIQRINSNTLKSSAFNSIKITAQSNRLKIEYFNKLQEVNFQNMQLKCKLKDFEKSIIELEGKFQGAQQGYLRKKDELKIAVDQRQRIKKISVQVAKKSYEVEDELKEMRDQNQKYRLKVSATIKWVTMSQSLRIVNNKLKMLQFKKQHYNNI